MRHEAFLTSCFNWLKKQQMDDQSKDVSPSLRASPPFGGVERIHTRAARGRRRQRTVFNCNMLMCVICQKFYSKNPFVVYFGVGIPQRKVFLAQGWVKPFKLTWIHSNNNNNNNNNNNIIIIIIIIITIIMNRERNKSKWRKEGKTIYIKRRVSVQCDF